MQNTIRRMELLGEMAEAAGGVLAEEAAAIGRPVDNGAIRIERGAVTITVTDLRYAGNRGKRVDQFVLYDLDKGLWNEPKAERLVDQFERVLPNVRSYKKALAMAKGIVDEFSKMGMGSVHPKVEERSLKGAEVEAAGERPINDKVGDFTVRIDRRGWTIQDMGDQYNLSTIYANGTKDASRVRKWYDENRGKMARMTLSQVQKELDKVGVNYRYYCAMD